MLKPENNITHVLCLILRKVSSLPKPIKVKPRLNVTCSHVGFPALGACCACCFPQLRWSNVFDFSPDCFTVLYALIGTGHSNHDGSVLRLTLRWKPLSLSSVLSTWFISFFFFIKLLLSELINKWIIIKKKRTGPCDLLVKHWDVTYQSRAQAPWQSWGL